MTAKIAEHLQVACYTYHLSADQKTGEASDSQIGVVLSDCQSWGFTGRSIKTPQLTKEQQQASAVDTKFPEMEEYVIKYSETFIDAGSVEFRYRAYTKILGKNRIKNGILTFLIDGVDQNIVSDHLLAGIWIPIVREVMPGYHTMEWRY